ncbi:MAG: protein-tyrosine-phosphatase [Candidatus Latescibacteria bacterium]|nr:protein-tyrosine-phosphatase [Candidatus Latescibacterota bacterium]
MPEKYQNIRNLRDVGQGINTLLKAKVLQEGVLFRSGALDKVEDPNELPRVNTIINLRRTPDPALGRGDNISAAPLETMNNYMVEEPVFKEWIQRVFASLLRAKWPVLLHCTAGKDRTGVVVAILLRNIGIPDRAIVDEYLLSDGRCYRESMVGLLRKFASNRQLLMEEEAKRELRRKLYAEGLQR